MSEDNVKIIADFENGTLGDWRAFALGKSNFVSICNDSDTGSHALRLGPNGGNCSQGGIAVRPDSAYRLEARVKTDSGSGEVMVKVRDYGGLPLSVSSALADYTKVSLGFETASTVDAITVGCSGNGYVDRITLTFLGDAPNPKVQEFMDPLPRVIKEQDGAAQLPDDQVQWYLDARFGMFIHWGVYAAIGKGEWVMHNEAIPPEEYRRMAEDPETGFTASRFDPRAWAELAKKAGMTYAALTTRHHDGYALFDSRHENSWTSVQQLGRDLIKEYTDAFRSVGLQVGLYFSPMSWRYPGYYDLYGTACKPNAWGYTTDPAHKENARVMKEEVYEQVTRLLKNYGPIEYMFWDGGWLGQTSDKEMERLFWDSGMRQDPENEWPVSEKYLERDPETGEALGIIGLVRKYQPQLIVNERFGWIGDVHGEEGSSPTTGPVRQTQLIEKCCTLKGSWGYRPEASVRTFEEIAVYLSDCVVRNMNLLLNVSPDRHGEISKDQQESLGQMGRWLEKVGKGIYNTRGGPWQPLHGEYGFTYRDDTIYCHIYEGYRGKDSGTFITQSIGDHEVDRVTDLFSSKELSWEKKADNTVTIKGVDYATNPMVTMLELKLKQPVYPA